MKSLVSLSLLLFLFVLSCNNQVKNKIGQDYIKPFADNKKYWEYKGEPVLLLGGTKNDIILC